MSALVDSQEELQDDHENVQNNSQDLFEEEHYRPVIENNIGRQILSELRSLQRKFTIMEENLSELQKRLVKSEERNTFSIESCTFKKQLCIFLKTKFSRGLWLDVTTDVEFKKEVKKHLKKDGFSKDNAAYKQVISFSSSKFADLRSQLRRKIFQTLKEGKHDLQSLQIDEFSRILLGTFCSALEEHDAPERVQLCLVLRSFLHKRGLFATKEPMPDFWDKFKLFYDKTIEDTGTNEQIWETLSALDTRRVMQRLDVLREA